MIQDIVKPSLALAPAQPSTYQVREVCAALGVSTSGFYAHHHKAQRPRRRQD